MKDFDKNEALHILKQEVQEHFGRPLATSRDCILLSEEIFQKTNFKLNANTLRRFFGLVKATYPPSSATLSILSGYCGFPSMDELMKHHKKRIYEKDNHTSEAILRYFINLFKDTKLKEPVDETFLALVKQTILFLQQHPGMASKLQKAIAKTANGQRYYFEQYAHIDQLNSFYGEGLHYYLKENKTLEAQIRGNALLLQRGWLMNDIEAVRKHFGKIKELSVNGNMHPVICGRYFASRLFHANIEGLSTAEIIQEAIKHHQTIIPAEGYYLNFPAFEYTFSIALTLTQHFSEALYFLNQAETKYKFKHTYIEEGLYETMRLLKSLALVRTGQKAEAKELFEKLKPSKFYFLTKKTNSIFYLLLAEYFNKKTHKGEEQLHVLVKTTGFVKMLDLKMEEKEEKPAATLLHSPAYKKFAKEVKTSGWLLKLFLFINCTQ